MRLPFDAHNHVHLGPTSPLRALVAGRRPSENGPAAATLCGMALMSTHPRDFDRVLKLSTELPEQQPGVQIVPCFGVHPWFLHELSPDDIQPRDPSADPKWLKELEHLIEAHPGAVVGEIGLDGHRYNAETGELTCPMERQVEAFEQQMKLAARLQRPVSIHSVQCWGIMIDILSRLKRSYVGLPPTVYFHAFGGKVGSVDQLTAVCGRENGCTFFGFAPVINFRSPKTSEVIRKVGIDRLVLETDHEDAGRVPESMEAGIRLIAKALEISEAEVIEHTTRNAFDLYRLCD